jgi:O-antigen/teichoic acid export membrane protein
VLRLVAIVALLWLGVVLVKRLGRPSEERDPFLRRVLTVFLLSVVLVAPAILLARFAFRSGNAALILIALLASLTLAVTLAWSVGRMMIVGWRRHDRPPYD